MRTQRKALMTARSIYMNFALKLREQGLGSETAIVIGSGILNALGIRESKDIDLVVTPEEYVRLSSRVQFKKEEYRGRVLLRDDLFEIGTEWGVLGKNLSFGDLLTDTCVIDGVRYITPEFLLSVKQSWEKAGEAREKDLADIALIEAHLARGST